MPRINNLNLLEGGPDEATHMARASVQLSTFLDFMYPRPEDTPWVAGGRELSEIAEKITAPRRGKGAPDISLWKRNGVGGAEVMLVRKGTEKFYRTALCRSRWSGLIDVASHHFDSRDVSRRLSGKSFSGLSHNSTLQTLNINPENRNYVSQVASLVFESLEPTAFTISRYVSLQMNSLTGLMKKAAPSYTVIQEKIKTYVAGNFSDRLHESILVAAFECLEHVALGTARPTIDINNMAQHKTKFLQAHEEVNAARRDYELCKGMGTALVLKLADEEAVYILHNGHLRKLSEFPESIITQVATVMSAGDGEVAVCGVGAKRGTGYPVELAMAVAVPAGTVI